MHVNPVIYPSYPAINSDLNFNNLISQGTIPMLFKKKNLKYGFGF